MLTYIYDKTVAVIIYDWNNRLNQPTGLPIIYYIYIYFINLFNNPNIDIITLDDKNIRLLYDLLDAIFLPNF